MSTPLSRRRLLARMAQICAGGVLAASAGAAGAAGAADSADTACVDLKAMSAGEVASRNSLHWTAMSTQADKKCAMCNFFSATSGACGACVILGGPTYATGYCDSWTAKDS